MAEATRYDAPREEAEILPNLLGLTTRQEIDEAEFEGLYRAQAVSIDELTSETRFTLSYILQLHQLLFDNIYSFAGKLRTVNISKAGFLFPAAEFLDSALSTFENEMLNTLPNTYSSKEQLVENIAKVHAELLFIHPFREGNGRVARLLANAMAVKEGYSPLHFEQITKNSMDEYINAVQKAAEMDYEPMRKIIAQIL